MQKITPLTDTKLLAALHKSAFEPAGAVVWDAPAFDALLQKSGARAFGTKDGFILMQPFTNEAESSPLPFIPPHAALVWPLG